jgi:hypothetical protein
METSKKITIRVPLEEIIDQWFEERRVKVVWSDEKLRVGKHLDLDLIIDDTGDIQVENTMFYQDVQEFLSEFEVHTG